MVFHRWHSNVQSLWLRVYCSDQNVKNKASSHSRDSATKFRRSVDNQQRAGNKSNILINWRFVHFFVSSAVGLTAMPEAIRVYNMDISQTKKASVSEFSKHWTGEKRSANFQPDVVKDIYAALDTSLVTALDLSGYLESYLWPNYSANSSKEHLFSILILLHEKYRQGLSVWRT